MKYLRSDTELITLLSRAPYLSLFLDFDGTLVPLAPRPHDITVPPVVMPLLTKLSQKPGCTVGIVTGRSLGSLSQHFHAPPGVLVGASHGLEWVIDGRHESVVLPDGYLPALHGLYDDLVVFAGRTPGLDLEWKDLSLSARLRMVPEEHRDRVRNDVLTLIKNAPGNTLFSIVPGATDLDVRPNIDWTKADIISYFLKEARVDPEAPLLYIGDDTTDEDVFRAFPKSVTVRVGKSADTKARYYVRGVSDVLSFLRELSRDRI